MIEIRDPATGETAGKHIGAQVKTREAHAYTVETDADIKYVLDADDLEYWRGSNVPVIIILVRLSDNTMFWKHVDTGMTTEPRRPRLAGDPAIRDFADWLL